MGACLRQRRATVHSLAHDSCDQLESFLNGLKTTPPKVEALPSATTTSRSEAGGDTRRPTPMLDEKRRSLLAVVAAHSSWMAVDLGARTWTTRVAPKLARQTLRRSQSSAAAWLLAARWPSLYVTLSPVLATSLTTSMPPWMLFTLQSLRRTAALAHLMRSAELTLLSAAKRYYRHSLRDSAARRLLSCASCSLTV